jgi:uncharacterized phiE125 gp8 family phage protein
MLIEQDAVPGSALPMQAMKDHLRLGTGFSDDGMQDGLIEGYLRAALAAIEGRIGKVLIARRFLMQLSDWRGSTGQAFPVAPVTGIVEVAVIDAADVRVSIAPERYRLVPDAHRPKLVAVGGALPLVPTGGRIEVVFDAGFGSVWTAVPADLAQAVMLLATEYHENRHDTDGRGLGLPLGVQSLIERWRTVRVLGGGSA